MEPLPEHFGHTLYVCVYMHVCKIINMEKRERERSGGLPKIGRSAPPFRTGGRSSNFRSRQPSSSGGRRWNPCACWYVWYINGKALAFRARVSRFYSQLCWIFSVLLIPFLSMPWAYAFLWRYYYYKAYAFFEKTFFHFSPNISTLSYVTLPLNKYF